MSEENQGFRRAVVMGGSAGALDALSQILPGLPKDFAFPIFIVVHVPAQKDSLLAEVLQNKCQLKVHEAEDKEPIEPGNVYLAPPDYHLLIEDGGYLSLSADEAVLFSRPSIDVLFESAADVYGAGLIGIILSGANNDGARGLKAVAEMGGAALVQNPEQALAKMMPEEALAQCGLAQMMRPAEIVEYLLREAQS